jgi:uncharacterized protein
MSTGQIGLTVKATRLCNLRCTYCHDWRSGAGHTMSFEVLAHLIHAACTDPHHGAVSFGWHGGEPLVLPIQFYETALTLQARYRRPGQFVQNRLQTNATLVTDEWAQFLVRERFGVGVSVDGPRDVHDRTRVDLGGAGSFDKVMEGLERLRFAGLAPGILLTVDKDTVALGAERTLAFLLSIGARSIGFNPVQPANSSAAGTVGDGYLTRSDMNRFLIDLHRCWVDHGDPQIRIRELDSLVARIDGGTGSTCTLEGDCVGSFFAVEPDGEVAHCDRFFGEEAYQFGSIMHGGFDRIRRNVKLLERRAADAAAADRRRRCENFAVCSGGCPQQTFLERRHDPGHDDGCCGRGELIEHLRTHRGLSTAPVRVGLPKVPAAS